MNTRAPNRDPARPGLAAALRRRGWVLVVATAGVAAVSYGVATVRPDPFTAESVLVVPSGQDPSANINADQANRLAVTYSKLIPEDARVLERVGRALDLSPASVRRRLRVEAEPDTSLLRMRFRAKHPAAAVAGARAVAEAVAGERPASAAIPPRSMTIVSSPQRGKTRTSVALDGTRSYSAEAVLTLPTSNRPGGPASPDQANKIASNYAKLIPEDARVLDYVARQLRLPLRTVRERVSVANDGESSLVRVRFRDTPDARAIAGARHLAQAVSGASPASPTITPGSLKLVRFPEIREGVPSRGIDGLPIGLVLGLCMGAILIVAWERADPRTDDITALSAEAQCPASSLSDLSTGSIAALLDRWQAMAETSPAKVAILAAAPRLELTAAVVAQQILAAGRAEQRTVSDSADYPPVKAERQVAVGVGATNGADEGSHPSGRFGKSRSDSALSLVAGGAPGSEAAGEALALGSDLIVLVAAKGTRVADVRSSVAMLGEFNAAPAWALLAPRVGGPLARRRRRRWLRERTAA